MLLALDVGNTNTVLGLYRLDGEGRANDRFGTCTAQRRRA